MWSWVQYLRPGFVPALHPFNTQKHPLVIKTRFPSEQEQRGECYTLSLNQNGNKFTDAPRPKLQRAHEPTLITLKQTQLYVSSSRSASGADNLSTLCPPICFQSCRPQARLYAAHLAEPGTPRCANPLARDPVTPRRSNYKRGCACSTAEEGRLPSIILWLQCWPHGCLSDGRHACCSHRQLKI